MAEFVARLVLELISYPLGLACASVLLPWVSVEPLNKQKQAPRWKWRGFTYKRGNRTFLYTESVQLLGVVTILLAATIFALARHAA
jgi:hypothetical protein